MPDSQNDNPIERLASKLQRLPSAIRWLYMQQELIEAEAFQTKPTRGPRSALADRMAAVAIRLRIDRVLAATVMTALLLFLLVRQYLSSVENTTSKALFVGIKAPREPELVRLFQEQQKRQALHIDERSLHDFYRFGRATFFASLREARMVWREIRRYLHSSVTHELHYKYLLTFVMLQGARYTFLRAWFRRHLVRSDFSGLVACSSAGYVPFAAIAAGARAVYFQHGFQRHSLVYPEFVQAICLNRLEAEQLRRRLPNCAVTLVPEQPRQIQTSKTLAISGGQFLDLKTCELIRPVIHWAVRNEMPVAVRPHPRDKTDYWDRWRGVEGVEIVGAENSFSDFLENVRPRFLAGWYSTALFDALLRGVVPITVAAEGDKIADIVFPLGDIALHWPEDVDLAQSFLDDEEMRATFLAGKWAFIGADEDAASDRELAVRTSDRCETLS
jgi:hypothetical protein